MNLSSYMPYKVRELVDRATNIVCNHSAIEVKVLEATNNEPWGPSGSLLQELAKLTYSSTDEYREVKTYEFIRRKKSKTSFFSL